MSELPAQRALVKVLDCQWQQTTISERPKSETRAPIVEELIEGKAIHIDFKRSRIFNQQIRSNVAIDSKIL